MRNLAITLENPDGSRPDWTGKGFTWYCKRDTPADADTQDCEVWLDVKNPGRIRLSLPDNAEDGLGFNWKIKIDSFSLYSFRARLFPIGNSENGVPVSYTDPFPLKPLEPSANFFKFPTSDKREPLGPKEPDSSFGRVYYTLPPEFVALPGFNPKTPDINLIRADIYSYVTPWAPQEINPICDFNFLVRIGQNTNYGMKMWYVPLLSMYPRDVQDAFIRDYAPWNTHIFIEKFNASFDDLVDLFARCAAAGLYRGYVDRDANNVIELVNRNAVDVVIAGFEINDEDPNVADFNIRQMAAVCKPKNIPLWLHFASQGGPNHSANWGLFDFQTWWSEMYDIGVTGGIFEAYMTGSPDPDYSVDNGADPNLFINPRDGRLGTMGDNAGKMGAMQVYMREGMMRANSNLKYIGGEIWSEPVFNGYTDKNFARRRAFECLCAPSENRMLTNCGYLDGPVNPDGSVI